MKDLLHQQTAKTLDVLLPLVLIAAALIKDNLNALMRSAVSIRWRAKICTATENGDLEHSVRGYVHLFVF
jgi:hypothetical protein